ncbi:MAG: hypothetical protein IKV41_02660 [Oscillospiraceae bacterium]|nr:hypothetical protein [Oscillospiraceae bacterium]
MTMYKRITAILFMALIMFLTTGTLGKGLLSFQTLSDSTNVPFHERFENFISSNFPFSDRFKSFAIRIKRVGGTSMQKGVFIGDDILLENTSPPADLLVKRNVEKMLEFANDSAVPVYAMIIPEKCAVKQQEIPNAEYVQLFNQKDFIEQVGDAFSGKISMVDAYFPLFLNQDKYIYYRTDPRLTSLGAYYVYQTLASRLNVRAPDITRYTIQHTSHDFYGETYDRFPLSDVEPDVISLYHLRSERSVKVKHNTPEEQIYDTLYPNKENANPIDVYLGGNSGDIELRANVNSAPNRTLLVFGDDSMMPILPFLSANFDEIRFIDLSKVDESDIFSVDVFYYDQVLFAYSVETFAHTSVPSRIEFS